MKSTPFAMCVSNAGYPASLEPAKFYRQLGNHRAESAGLVRIIDESGEDCLYPARLFRQFDLPETMAKTLRRVLPRQRRRGAASGS